MAEISQPIILVDSLYGPGTFACWLLTLASVFTSWMFDRQLAATDSISLDFLMALALPCIACGHLVFLVARLPASLRDVLFDPDLAPHAAAIEAPLIICTVFGTLVPLLVALPLWRSGFDPRFHRKRALLAFVTWLGCEVVHWTILAMVSPCSEILEGVAPAHTGHSVWGYPLLHHQAYGRCIQHICHGTPDILPESSEPRSLGSAPKAPARRVVLSFEFYPAISGLRFPFILQWLHSRAVRGPTGTQSRRHLSRLGSSHGTVRGYPSLSLLYPYGNQIPSRGKPVRWETAE